MSKLRQLETSSTISWSPVRSSKDTIVLASLNGLTNLDFDSSSKLELLNPSRGTVLGHSNLNEKVNCLSWGCPNRTKGIIAAGYADGSIGFYDPAMLLEG